MKKEKLIFLLFFIGFSSCHRISEKELQSFSKISAEFNNVGDLAKFINPNRPFDYWEYRWTDFFNRKYSAQWEDRVFATGGQMGSDSMKKIFPTQGFFKECMPGYCVSYILVETNHEIEQITTESQLRQFIGHIDNLQEALLVLKSYGYWFDSEVKEAGAYKFNQDAIELLGIESISTCPLRIDRVYIKMTYDGQIETYNLGTHSTSSDCFIF
jgi:hypothetical protein